MVSKKNLELLEKIADLCNQASEEMEDTEGTNEILCLCDEMVEKIDALEEEHVEGQQKLLRITENGYADSYIFIPDMKQIIRITEGSGDNLLPEDIEEGYTDYIYYEQYELSQGFPEVDGGQVLLKEIFRNKYNGTADSIFDVLDMAYGNSAIDYKILG